MSRPANRDMLTALRQFVEETPVLSGDGRFMRTGDGVPMAVLVALAQEAIPKYQRRMYWEQFPDERCFECGQQCTGHPRP